MAELVEINGTDLAAMLCSRVCHDLISPVGAIGNGLEVLADPEQAEMAEFAQELINNSAKQARAKLEFARLAFGASSTQGTEIDTREAEKVAQSYMAGEKADLDWKIEPILLPKNKVKMILNLLLIAAGSVPRGGTVSVELDGAEMGKEGVILKSSGKKTLIPHLVGPLLAGKPEDGRIDAQVIQPYYAGLLARDCGLDVTIEMVDDVVIIKAVGSA
ncbi:histidine phosphotransferase ChpT [Maritalea porphyrae]|uniref:Histidine phosphotransferase n=1 Tax=Maritalea porphyrae TaxID=880732 RepID=A0ABQ5UPC1_9HYPH|nr:histidine phosphotransferase family protein [Maritalea porphyrae]GLQ16191.1 histidine phosphotransferase [Maritalea porphyrae]